MTKTIEEVASDEFEKHWQQWRYAFHPSDINARLVMINAFNEGIKLGMQRIGEMLLDK